MTRTVPEWVDMLHGSAGVRLRLPGGVERLQGAEIPALPDPAGALAAALAAPLGAPPLGELLRQRRPRRVAITVSDSTRPVPYREFLPALLTTVREAGIPDAGVVLVIGTGMHRPSTAAEREQVLGSEILSRYEVVDHCAKAPETLVTVSREPLVRVCRRFAEADFRIVTGFIEPHFMAGFSGGRKGVCPALVDLETVQRFHGFATLAEPRAEAGVLAGNPCHALALEVAQRVGVDFLVNVAITRDRRLAGLYCGELTVAHEAGCREVEGWVRVNLTAPYDLVITTGGGSPLDRTFYQTVKGMCGALPALHDRSLLLVLSECSEGLGSAAYAELLLEYGRDWRRFLADAGRPGEPTRLDQWELQMQCRVLQRIGHERLLLATDGLPQDLVARLALRPVAGTGRAVERAQAYLDHFVSRHPRARVAVIPEGPYALLGGPGAAPRPA